MSSRGSRGLPADRELRRHRQPAHGRAGRACDGSIDWLCLPHFDSPSVFAAHPRRREGRPLPHRARRATASAHKQFYWPDTNVLITRFLHAGRRRRDRGLHAGRRRAAPSWHDQLVRRVRVRRAARCAFRLECRPAFDYARAPHETTRRPSTARVFDGPGLSLGARDSSAAARATARGVAARLHARRGRERDVRPAPARRRTRLPARCPAPSEAEELFRDDRRLLAALARRAAPTAAAGARWCTARRWR